MPTERVCVLVTKLAVIAHWYKFEQFTNYYHNSDINSLHILLNNYVTLNLDEIPIK